MSMGKIARSMKATRTQMIESEAERAAEDFAIHFNLRDGDYIRYHSWRGTKIARIMSAEHVHYNQAGGWTASVVVAPLLAGGVLGTTRRLILCINANGKGLCGLGMKYKQDQVEVVTPSRAAGR